MEDYKLQEATVSLTVSERPQLEITSPVDVYNAFRDIQNDLKEKVFVIHVNGSHKVLCFELVHIGGMGNSTVDVRCIFRTSLLVGATAILLLHNHPSGNEKPSKQDIELTKAVREAGKVLNINLLDHIIIAGDSYLSFLDQKIILEKE